MQYLGYFVELTKPRIVLLITLTVVAGFWLASPPLELTIVLFHAALGMALVASSSNALNQIVEVDVDALMKRTRDRPLPSGHLTRKQATVFATVLGVVGVTYLAFVVNLLCATIAAATLLIYVFVYTPLKKRSTLASLVGAIPGALPILGGWAAATGALSPRALSLFAILFFWQLPHVFALGWVLRKDYKNAGLRLPGVGDDDGMPTFLYASAYAAALVPVSLIPALLGVAGQSYFVGALVMSMMYLALCVIATLKSSTRTARMVFAGSLVYLPSILILMSVTRIP